MKKLLEPEKGQIIELRVYELLGVKRFRKLIFKIENIRHRQDGKYNINYHLTGGSLYTMKEFIGYLYYNTACHAISLAFVVVFLFASVAFQTRNHVLDIATIILSIVNIYCIILQRYTYLKLSAVISKKTIKRNNAIVLMASALKQAINNTRLVDIQEERELIQKIYMHAQNGTNCILSASDVPVLERISDTCGKVISVNRTSVISCDGIITKLTTSILRETPFVISSVEMRAAKLQYLLHSDKRTNLSFGFGIITETPECETAYQRLFPFSTRDSMELLLEALVRAYRNC